MNERLSSIIELEEKKQSKTSSLIKFLVFSMGKLTLALPVEQVKKVTKYLPIHGSGTSYVNLTHIGRQEVTVVDLHQKLFEISLDTLSPEGGYFILTKSTSVFSAQNEVKVDYPTQAESIGIRVLETPSLIDIALSNIRTLPNSYRYADTLKIASHVAVIEEKEGVTKTIFILDLEHLI